MTYEICHEDEIAIIRREGYFVVDPMSWWDAVEHARFSAYRKASPCDHPECADADDARYCARRNRAYERIAEMFYPDGIFAECGNIAGPRPLHEDLNVEDFAAVNPDNIGDAMAQLGIEPPRSAREMLEIRTATSLRKPKQKFSFVEIA
jgi:hypothetical protein